MRSPGLDLEFTLVHINGGEFLMGSCDGRDDERPVHRVRLGSFELGRCQVTNEEYEIFTRATGRPAPANRNDSNLNHPHQPVVAVSWFDAMSFCEWLSVDRGHRYRLPTEAEWEFAARGGAPEVPYPWGDTAPEWYREGGARLSGPVQVGLKPSNGYGLHDLCENVHEWCSDWYGHDYYAVSPTRNPPGPEAGSRRVSRGGSWRHQLPFSRCAARSSIPPGFRYTDYGFRIACDSPAASELPRPAP